MTKRRKRLATSKSKSAVSKVKMSGYDLAPRGKPKGKLATLNDYAKATWEPWEREPGMRPGQLPSNDTMIDLAIDARLAHAIVCMEREGLIAMHGKIEHDQLDKLAARMVETAERLKMIVLMIDQANLRLTASMAAAYKRGTKFPGVHDLRKKKRTVRAA